MNKWVLQINDFHKISTTFFNKFQSWNCFWQATARYIRIKQSYLTVQNSIARSEEPQDCYKIILPMTITRRLSHITYGRRRTVMLWNWRCAFHFVFRNTTVLLPPKLGFWDNLSFFVWATAPVLSTFYFNRVPLFPSRKTKGLSHVRLMKRICKSYITS